MKKIIIISFAVLLGACNNSGNDTVNTADSANRANQDSALNNNQVVIDENSSSFLTKVANAGMAEAEITSMARDKAVNQPVKDFAGMLYNDHSAVNAQVKSMAASKNVVLPDSISSEKRDQISDLNKKTGKNFDREFLSVMVKNHEASIDLFEKAMTEAKDADVRSFADKTLPTLRIHLDSARALQKKY